MKRRVKKRLEEALKERKKLGLDVPPINHVALYWCGKQHADGSAYYEKGKESSIMINVLNAAYPHLPDEAKTIAAHVRNYFFTIGDFFNQTIADSVSMATLYKSERQVKKAMEQHLKENKAYFEQCGRPGDYYLEFALHNREEIQQLLQQLKPLVRDAFRKADLSWLRHEVDHLDFQRNAEMARIERAKKERARTQEEDFAANPSPAKSRTLAHLKRASLDYTMDTNILMEMRAITIECVPSNEWTEENINKAERSAKAYFIRNYIEGLYLLEILDTLVCQAWAEGRMNRDTSNLLHSAMFSRTGSATALRYKIDLPCVDSELFSEIMYQQLPAEQQKLAEKTHVAAKTFAKVFREDPPRMHQANKARTFKQYIHALR